MKIDNTYGAIYNTVCVRWLRVTGTAPYSLAAGLEKELIKTWERIELDWMLPAPASGAIVVFEEKIDLKSNQILSTFND